MAAFRIIGRIAFALIFTAFVVGVGFSLADLYALSQRATVVRSWAR